MQSIRAKLIAGGLVCSYLLTGLTSARADEQEIRQLNEKQALLTRQLNAGEKIGSAYGRYVTVRDLFMVGSDGIIQQSTQFFNELDAWILGWGEVLNRLESEDIVDVVSDPQFLQTVADYRINFEKIGYRFTKIINLTRTGLEQSRQIPRINLEEFHELKTQKNPEALFIDAFQEHLNSFYSSVDALEESFIDADSALRSVGSAAYLEIYRNYSNRIYTNIQLAAAMQKLKFPELEQQITLAERMLATEKVLNPVMQKAKLSFREGLDLVNQSDFLAAEQRLKVLTELHEYGFIDFESNQHLDQYRVKQNKALVQIQINNLALSLHNSIALEGGRANALRDFIRDKAVKSNRSPDRYCKLYSNQPSKFRYYFDCNLFRKNVRPFIDKLDQIDEAMLEVIVESLKRVYQGPLTKE